MTMEGWMLPPPTRGLLVVHWTPPSSLRATSDAEKPSW